MTGSGKGPVFKKAGFHTSGQWACEVHNTLYYKKYTAQTTQHFLHVAAHEASSMQVTKLQVRASWEHLHVRAA